MNDMVKSFGLAAAFGLAASLALVKVAKRPDGKFQTEIEEKVFDDYTAPMPRSVWPRADREVYPISDSIRL